MLSFIHICSFIWILPRGEMVEQSRPWNSKLCTLRIATPRLCHDSNISGFDAVVLKSQGIKAKQNSNQTIKLDRTSKRKQQEITWFSGRIWKSWLWCSLSFFNYFLFYFFWHGSICYVMFAGLVTTDVEWSNIHDHVDSWIYWLISNASFRKDIGNDICDEFISICCDGQWMLTESPAAIRFCPTPTFYRILFVFTGFSCFYIWPKYAEHRPVIQSPYTILPLLMILVLNKKQLPAFGNSLLLWSCAYSSYHYLQWRPGPTEQ